MCGIAGILNAGPDVRNFGNEVEAMRRALRHRGPDDAGSWHSTFGRAAFAHTRLSILDPRPTGRQPMSTPDGRFTITFNGEIYNFLELRRSLEESGVQFRTRTDTEVILRAYERDGPACFGKLRGMFALALWDEGEGICLLARDPLGIKPFYYHASSRQLTFASELRALVASGLVPRQLDPQAVYGYFRTGSVPEPRTLLSGVRCLEPGTYAVWRDGQLTPHAYWRLRFTPEPIGEKEAIRVTRAALLDSVEHHFISDVPVGVFLSGGIDSTALVSLARTVGRTDLHTFSISLPDSPNDEGAIARRTAEHFGTTHHDWALNGALAKALFKQFLSAADQPSIDGFNTFAVSKLAHENGLKVALSGVGGDELFGGYKSFRYVPRLANWNRRLRLTGPLSSGIGAALGRAPRPQWRRLGEMLSHEATLGSAHAALRGIYTHVESSVLAAQYTGAIPLAEDIEDNTDLGADPTQEDSVSRLELTRYMRNQLLRDSDVMSMAWGLELRVPFVDLTVVEALARVPSQVRLKPGKRLLLDAVPEIPPWVSRQPKRAFLFPFEQWLEGDWRGVFDAIDRSCPVPTQTWYRKWCVFVFERWLQEFVPSPAPAASTQGSTVESLP